MSFLHFWALGIGGLALAAPLAVHFLTKPRPVSFGLSTVRFLREVIEQRKAKSRFRDFLILLLRMICVGLLALGLSRPLLKKPPVVALEATGETSRVLVVDVSQSMMAGTGGVTAWTEAQASGLLYLDSGPGTLANIVFAGAKGRSVFDNVSPNLTALREALRQAEPVAERADPRAAMELAGRLLAESSTEKKELVVISDFQRSNWATLPLEQIPTGVNIQFHSVAQLTLSNVSINAVHFSSEPVAGQPAILEVVVANDSDSQQDVQCQVELGGLRVSMESSIPAKSSATLTETLIVPNAGWQYGWARLESHVDSLLADDQRPIAVRVRPPIQTLLVSRQPDKAGPTSSFYLHRALEVVLSSGQFGASAKTEAATENQASNKIVQRVNPMRMDIRSWPETAVLVLDHCGALSDETIQTLGNQLRRGKGVLYVASEFADAANLDQLGVALGSDFQPPVVLKPTEAGQVRKDLFVLKADNRKTPFSVLDASSDQPLRGALFSGGLATEATSEVLKSQVLAELSDTSALLYVTSVGAGKLAVLNADLGESNWPVQPSFLPVLGELISLLSGGQDFKIQPAPGEPVVRLLPNSLTTSDGINAGTVSGTPPPDNNYGKWSWSASQAAVTWSWPEPSGPGVYKLEKDGEPLWMLATCAPDLESELSSLDESVLIDRVGAGRNVGYRSTKSEESGQEKTWSWLIVGCLLGLISEIIALRISRM